jgi:hypothetical protein
MILKRGFSARRKKTEFFEFSSVNRAESVKKTQIMRDYALKYAQSKLSPNNH